MNRKRYTITEDFDGATILEKRRYPKMKWLSEEEAMKMEKTLRAKGEYIIVPFECHKCDETWWVVVKEWKEESIWFGDLESKDDIICPYCESEGMNFSDHILIRQQEESDPFQDDGNPLENMKNLPF